MTLFFLLQPFPWVIFSSEGWGKGEERGGGRGVEARMMPKEEQLVGHSVV